MNKYPRADIDLPKSVTQKISTREWLSIFKRAVSTYIFCAISSPLTASNPDQDAPRPMNWAYRIDFCADIENATKKALTKRIGDYDIWKQLVRKEAGMECEKVTSNDEARIVTACGKLYQSRGLDNARQYFSCVKKRAVT